MGLKKIMMVDDENDQIFTLQCVLKAYDKDYEIIGVTSGEQCLKQLEKEKLPDLILLDIMMPGMSGWEVFDKIKSNPAWRDIPIIFLTARDDDIAVNAGKTLGDNYLKKPYEVEELLHTIDRIIQTK